MGQLPGAADLEIVPTTMRVVLEAHWSPRWRALDGGPGWRPWSPGWTRLGNHRGPQAGTAGYLPSMRWWEVGGDGWREGEWRESNSM